MTLKPFLKRNRGRLFSSPANYSLKLKVSSGMASSLPDPVRNFSYKGKGNWAAFGVVFLT